MPTEEQAARWREKARHYYEKHKDEINARKREKWRQHPELRSEQRRKYRANPVLREKILESVRRHMVSTKIIMLKALGSHCVGCGEDDIRVLTMNHKAGAHRPRNNPNRNVSRYKLDRNDLSVLDVRCMNCQFLYDYERGIRRLPNGWPTSIDAYGKDGKPL